MRIFLSLPERRARVWQTSWPSLDLLLRGGWARPPECVCPRGTVPPGAHSGGASLRSALAPGAQPAPLHAGRMGPPAVTSRWVAFPWATPLLRGQAVDRKAGLGGGRARLRGAVAASKSASCLTRSVAVRTRLAALSLPTGCVLSQEARVRDGVSAARGASGSAPALPPRAHLRFLLMHVFISFVVLEESVSLLWVELLCPLVRVGCF